MRLNSILSGGAGAQVSVYFPEVASLAHYTGPSRLEYLFGDRQSARARKNLR